MPIRVSCQCGQSFAAPDHLAGKRVKCPKCAQPLEIPSAAAPAAKAAKASHPAKAAAPARRPAPQGEPDPDDLAPAAPPRDLFSEAGMNRAAAGTTPCPECSKPMVENAVLCVHCGFHKTKGRKIHGVATAKSSGDGHGDAGGAQALLARAAERIADEKAEEAKTRSEGMPAWGYGLLLVALLIVAAIFMTTGVGTGFIVAAYLGWAACAVAETYYGVLVLLHAFNKAPVQGLLCFVPFYVCYYAYLHWNEVGESFTMMIYFGLGATVCSGLYWLGVTVVAFSQRSGEASLMLPWTTMYL